MTIGKRVQTPTADAPSIAESLQDPIRMHADIRSLGPLTFVGAEATDRPITNRIYLRWVDWIDLNHVILRSTQRADGSTRTEVYRIRKIGEVDGRKRFVEILAELEHRE